MALMANYQEKIDQVAELMEEFRLMEAHLQQGDLAISFRRRASHRTAPAATPDSPETYEFELPAEAAPVAPAAPNGNPITSPMMGIYYGSPSPGASPFAKEGDEVSPGQVIGLIEAMKVFNEIPCPFGGTVLQVLAQSGQVVNPGDILMYVG